MTPATAPASVVELNTSFVGIAERVGPAVVSIAAERTEQPTAQRRPNIQRRNQPPGIEDFFQQFGPQEQQRPAFSSGTGFIVSKDGYILTNNHVVENMDRITVTLIDRRQLSARIVGRDPQTDVAVLKVTGTDLPVAAFGNDEAVKVGEWVLAIGNPLGLDHTVTAGIVSAKGRGSNDLRGLNTDRYAIQDFIQTDAAINPGNSGGALVDSQGNLIGINTAIYSRSGGSLGIGFAIPISIARNVMEQIIQTGVVTRGWIGVEAQEITIDLAESFGLPDTSGALIAGVLRSSPADAGGIKPGDILLAVGGRPVKDPQGMLDLIAGQKPGETVSFQLRRQNKLFDTTVKIGKRAPQRRERE
ncbi:MAG: trypsin-like peptidase domain-containing protein [Gemmatimonadetes bacterium]|nr:trypsin-like peptidase domain-containing protein [Gemmatimonadota bacterium]